MKRNFYSLLFVVAVLLLVHGCASKGEKMSQGDMKGHTIDIATGDFYEACDRWTPGDKVSFSFASSAPVMFNVHYHTQEGVKYAIEQTMTDKLDGSFIVQTDDIHCGMWKNMNDDFVTLTYDMNVEKQ